MQIDKGDAICFKETTALFLPRPRNIRNHKVKTDDNIAKNFCCFLENRFVIRVSYLEFFCRRTAVADADFLTEIDDFSVFWDVSLDDFLFIIA